MQKNYIYLSIHNYVTKVQVTFIEIIILLTHTGPAPIDLAHSLIRFCIVTDKDLGVLQSKKNIFMCTEFLIVCIVEEEGRK